MKITYYSEKINSFGGINFADYVIKQNNLYSTVDQLPGSRGVKASYSYSDLIRSYFLLILCGDECAEDITENLRGELEQIKNFYPSSADTLLRMQKELSTAKEIYVSASGIEHELNVNMDLNRLIVNFLVKCKQLNPEHDGYTFDYDNQFIPTDKSDSKRSYKIADGYFPGIASINNFPVYIENRKGNSNVKYKQEETLKRAYDLLGEFGIKARYSRMDYGSFTKEVIPIIEANSEFFFVRAQRCISQLDKIKEIAIWEDVEIGSKKYQTTSIEYAPFGWNKTYRYVIQREKNKDGQG